MTETSAEQTGQSWDMADLRAAVAAGIVTEAQAASMMVLAQDRAGKRHAMPAEDEPFEFFRGFSEIFVSIGLIILLSGILAFLGWVGGIVTLILLPLACAAIAWWWATYFTLRRRMNLPSMVLACAFGGGVYLATLTLLGQGDLGVRMAMIGAALVAAAAMAVWYRRFRLPFSAFVLALFVLNAIYAMTASLPALQGFTDGGNIGNAGLAGMFDLRNSPQFAAATLVFGLGAFVAAMLFDLRDPHRLGRNAATAFWLHLLAAPALVNTVALTLYNLGGAVGAAALAVALIGIAGLALLIDRRSFLSAAIAYIALVISWLVQPDDFGSWTMILILLGGFITALGTWWVPLRAALMRVLPAFPGKDRLPPYARAA